MAGVDKIRLEDLLKICPPEYLLKKRIKTFTSRSNIFQKTTLKSMLLLPDPRGDECYFISVTQVVNALLRSDELYCPFDQLGVAVAGATNAANTRWREAVTVSLFFRPFIPTLLTPPPTPTGILYSPQFRSHQETKMAVRRTQRSTSTILRKNRRLWTV